MKVVFMGNPSFAIPSLEKLTKSRHEVMGVVSNPPKPMGRQKNMKYTAVGEYAHQREVTLLEPVSLHNEKIISQLNSFKADVFVVVAYRILPKSIFAIPKLGSINLHASLLPEYRGAAPIQWVLMNGEKYTGVTTFIINPKVDTGDILLQKKIDIHDSDDFGILSEKLSRIGADLIINTLELMEEGKVQPASQDMDLVTQAPKISKEMTTINWNWPALKIHNWIRGLSPKPGMSTTLHGQRIRVFKTVVIDDLEQCIPGVVQNQSRDELIISTGANHLSIIELQQEGRKRLHIAEFLRGHTISIGEAFTW